MTTATPTVAITALCTHCGAAVKKVNDIWIHRASGVSVCRR